MSTPLDVTYRRASAMLERLRERVQKTTYLYEDRPGLAGLKLLLEVLAVLVSDADRRIEELYEKAKAGNDDQREDAREQISSEAKRQNRVVGLCLATLARTHGREFDPFIGPIGRLACLVAPDTELIVNAMPSAVEYQITDPLNGQLPGYSERPAPASIDKIGRAARDLVLALPRLVVLRYPSNEEIDSFSHLLLGHEIAHLALRENELGEKLAEAAYQKIRRQPDAPELSLDRAETLPQRSRNWFTELACDRVGLKMIGPAFYLALYEYAALREWSYASSDAGEIDSDYNEYPALAWRLSELGKLAESYLPQSRESPWKEIRGIFKALRSAIPEWEDEEAEEERRIVEEALMELTAHEATLLPEAPSARAVKAVEDHSLWRVAPGLRDFVAQNTHYSPERFQEDVAIVWDKLGAGIMPAERLLYRDPRTSGLEGEWESDKLWSLPIDWRSIVNGAYFYWWAHQDRQGEDQDNNRADASAMARGAVELSEIHRQALALQSELKVLNFRKADS